MTNERVADQFSDWKRRLAGEQIAVVEGEPQSGFYRNRRNGKQASAVCYWRDTKNGMLRCQIDGSDVGEMTALEQWPFASKEPVTHESFKIKIETGKWPDMDESAFNSLPQNREVIGGNNPPDELILLKEQIESARSGVSQYLKIESDEILAKAQSLRARLLELAGNADKKRDAEKRPHLEVCRIIDKKWKPLVEMASAPADAIRSAMRVWENEKDRRARIVAEEARKSAEATGKSKIEIPQEIPAAPIKGAYGRAASVRIVKVAVIIDQAKVYDTFKDREEIRALLQKMAQKSIDAGYDVPGIEIRTEKDVR